MVTPHRPRNAVPLRRSARINDAGRTGVVTRSQHRRSAPTVGSGIRGVSSSGPSRSQRSPNVGRAAPGTLTAGTPQRTPGDPRVPRIEPFPQTWFNEVTHNWGNFLQILRDSNADHVEIPVASAGQARVLRGWNIHRAELALFTCSMQVFNKSEEEQRRRFLEYTEESYAANYPTAPPTPDRVDNWHVYNPCQDCHYPHREDPRRAFEIARNEIDNLADAPGVFYMPLIGYFQTN